MLQAFATLPPLGGVVPEGGQRAITVEADDGRPFATRGAYRGERLTAADMPPHLAQAITAIEDRRFYSHWGIDLRGLSPRNGPAQTGSRPAGGFPRRGGSRPGDPPPSPSLTAGPSEHLTRSAGFAGAGRSREAMIVGSLLAHPVLPHDPDE